MDSNNCAASSISFTDLPQEVLKKILTFIVAPSSSGVLDEQSVVSAKHAYSLCCNHSSLYHLFRQMFHSFFLTYKMKVNTSALARLFGPSLRHVSIFLFPVVQLKSAHCLIAPDEISQVEWHAGATSFLNAFKKLPSRLHTLSIELYDPREVGFEDGLLEIVKSSSSTLHALRLAIPELDYGTLTPRIAPYLKNLNALCIENSSQLRAHDLLKLVEAPIRLERLALSQLGHESLAPKTLPAIGARCRELIDVEIVNVSLSMFSGVNDFISARNQTLCRFYTQLRSFFVVFGASPFNTLTSCPNLRHFTLGNMTGREQVLQLFQKLGGRLHSLRIHTFHHFDKQDLMQISRCLRSLRVLFVNTNNNRWIATYPDIEIFIKQVGPQLHELYFQSLEFVPRYEFLDALSACSNLHKLAVSTIRPQCPKEIRVLSSTCFTQMIQSICYDLRKFSWSIVPVRKGNCVCSKCQEKEIDHQVGAFILETLASHCHKLGFIELQVLDYGEIPDEDYASSLKNVQRKMQNTAFYVEQMAPFWYCSTEIPWRSGCSALLTQYRDFREMRESRRNFEAAIRQRLHTGEG